MAGPDDDLDSLIDLVALVYLLQVWKFSTAAAQTLIIAMIELLMLCRVSRFPPDERTCIKQTRAVQASDEVAFKDRFDCLVIGEFPTVVWLERRDEVTYPRNDDGSRFVRREAARADLPPVDLNRYTAQLIDDGIGYLTAFYGVFFDGITTFLRTMLTAITAVFVGTPWVITMGAIIAISYALAGTRITAFVGVSLAYLALFGFWQTAMDTMSLVVAALIICVAFGLPLGIWVGKSERGQPIITPILDIMQTILSFVYLLPAVAFFSIGKPPGILATVIFAMPPMVRLTALGIKHVPENTKEAGLAFGANPRELLLKVELPQALVHHGRRQPSGDDGPVNGRCCSPDRGWWHGLYRDRGTCKHKNRRGHSCRDRYRAFGDDDRSARSESQQSRKLTKTKFQ